MSRDPVAETSAGIRLAVKVIPRSPKTSVAGTRADRLLVRVTAPPVDQAANEAVVNALAERLGVSKGAVVVSSGHASRNKTVDVRGIRAAEARIRLGLV